MISITPFLNLEILRERLFHGFGDQPAGIDPIEHRLVLHLHQPYAEFAQQGVFIGEIAIEGRRCQIGAGADHVGRQAVDADLLQQLRGGGQDRLIGLAGPFLQRLGLGLHID